MKTNFFDDNDSKMSDPKSMQSLTNLTSNDIIAGNGKILSVHEYCVVIFV